MTALALLALRIGVQLALLHESTDPATGAPAVFAMRTGSSGHALLPGLRCRGSRRASGLADTAARIPTGTDTVRSPPAEFVKAVVVDTEMVSDFVDDGDRDLLDHVLLGVADLQDTVPIDGDHVG